MSSWNPYEPPTQPTQPTQRTYDVDDVWFSVTVFVGVLDVFYMIIELMFYAIHCWG